LFDANLWLVDIVVYTNAVLSAILAEGVEVSSLPTFRAH
jgi:hypothetical protein